METTPADCIFEPIMSLGIDSVAYSAVPSGSRPTPHTTQKIHVILKSHFCSGFLRKYFHAQVTISEMGGPP